jgi:hypothetical protein
MNLKKGKSPPRMYLTEQPTELDVLCGRGNIYSSHPGNVAFQRVICENMDKYASANGGRPEKVKVVDNVMKLVKQSGARIVKLEVETNRWYQISRAEAHQKCGHCLRDTIRSRNNAAGKSKGGNRSADNSPKSPKSPGRKNNKSWDPIQKQIQKARFALLDNNMTSIDDFVSTIVCGGGTIDPYYKKLSTIGGSPLLITNGSNNNKLATIECSDPISSSSSNDVAMMNTAARPDGCFSSLTSSIKGYRHRRQSSMILFDDEFPESNMDFSPSTFFNSLKIR